MGAILLFFLLNLATAEAGDPYHICSVSINSTNEINAFKKKLGNKNFVYHELTDFASGGGQYGDSTWFEGACHSGVQCDVLIVSGHFGGHFFGENTGTTLSLDDLERFSCDRICDGVLKRSREIFLFGCNTLADKDKDKRTPQEYLQVLLEDGIDRQQAERVVSARYSPLGHSFKDRMRRVFSGASHLYGFDSVGPAGNTVESRVYDYLNKIPDYHSHLLRMHTESMLSTMERAQGAAENPAWNSAMKGTHYAQCSGLRPTDPDYQDKEKICQLFKDEIPIEQRLQLAFEMVDSEKRLGYLPSLERFLNGINFDSLSSEAKDILRRIKGHPIAKKEVDLIINSLESTPVHMMDMIKFAQKVEWMSESQARAREDALIKKLLEKSTVEDVDAICSISKKYKLKDDYGPENFGGDGINQSNEIAAAGCLHSSHPQVIKQVHNQLLSKSEGMQDSILLYLAQMKIKDETILADVINRIKILAQKPGHISASGLIHSPLEGSLIDDHIASVFSIKNNTYSSGFASRYVERQTRSDALQETLFKMALTDSNSSYITALSKQEYISPKVQRTIRDGIASNAAFRTTAIKGLASARNLQPSTLDILVNMQSELPANERHLVRDVLQNNFANLTESTLIKLIEAKKADPYLDTLIRKAVESRTFGSSRINEFIKTGK